MCVWDENSGRIPLTDTLSLGANMARKRVMDVLEACTGKPCITDDPKRATMLTAGALSLCGTKASCICMLSQGRLRAVELQPVAGTAAQQRSIVFGWIGQQDPCADSAQTVRIRCPFGTVWIITDSRSGDAFLRITYAAKE